MPFQTATAFADFSQRVRERERFVLSRPTLDFLEEVALQARRRTTTLPANAHLWRAQLGCDEYIETDEENSSIATPPRYAPFGPERMLPESRFVGEGRTNPRGVAFLYLATNTDTAIAEMRPFPGDFLTLAQVRTDASQTLVDFRSKTFSTDFDLCGDKAVWRSMDIAMSRPTTRSDSSTAYIPTQIIAEYLLQQGFDGLVFRSGLEDGTNVCLFAPQTATVMHTVLYRAERVSVQFSKWPVALKRDSIVSLNGKAYYLYEYSGNLPDPPGSSLTPARPTAQRQGTTKPHGSFDEFLQFANVDLYSEEQLAFVKAWFPQGTGEA